MDICGRLRMLREERKLSQGAIERRTGIIRCYISRIEHGHAIPSLETLQKLARALEVPLYRLFYDGEVPPNIKNLLMRKSSDEDGWGSSGNDARFLSRFRKVLARMEERDARLLMTFAQKLASSSNGRRPRGSR